MENKLLTKELLEQYKKHPRILEVRFILLFDLFEKEFGYNGVMDIFNGLCIGFKRNKQVLDTVIAKRFDIKRKSKTSVVKWRQEVMFMAMCYGETPYKVAKKYLMVSPVNFYRKERKVELHAGTAGRYQSRFDLFCYSSLHRTGSPAADPDPG